MPIRRIAALLVCVLAAATAYADRGLPLLRIVPQREHRSGAQVFAVTQDASGILHFGTLSGVASYDGAAWRHLELPNGSAVFTVAGGASPRVAVGGVGEFGVLEPDANGVERYRSLLPQLPLAQRDVGEVRGSCAVGNGFVFVSERYLIASDGTSARVIADLRSMPAPPVHCRRAGNQYFFDSRDGLHRLDTASMTLVPYGLEGRNVGAIVPYDGTRILAAVAGEGLLLTDGAVVTPFAPEASAWLRGKEIITGCRLHDGRMAIATRTNGVLVIAADGAIDSIVDSAAGLPPDAVTDALADREGSLWVTLHG
ncbi:MAG TPA: hypothetical protein VF698_15350, partial [Thermoanaerobaculia bacterium]